jgi:hypothetical protein
MKQKTAMMELIERLKEIERNPDLMEQVKLGIRSAIINANDFLEKEKEQIELAYCSDYVGRGIDYYNQTYLNDNNL